MTQPVLSEVIHVHTAVVGSGAAGWNAAGRLAALGISGVAVVTEARQAGTSRNTGSDKQTYYKLGLSGDCPDSVYDMARTLFEGGATDGDTALCEAAASARCFFRLVELGVPFPHDGYGRYAGYKTDHDPARRATSCGPYTSRIMTERLERDALERGVMVLDGLRVVRLLRRGRRAAGLLALDCGALREGAVRYVPILCRHVVWATGGPAGLYGASAYPHSQWGGTGVALEAGAAAQNLTEWQYGLASVQPRWNVSGTYQQVLPRYVSTNGEGCDAREFLSDAFDHAGDMLTAVFMKGYQWPFDAEKAQAGGSSLIDLLVHREIRDRGRRVWLDFTGNPMGLPADKLLALLSGEAREYLDRSGAGFGTPIDRLRHMNPGAVELYRDKGVDLGSEMLEIAVCAQHHNGGLAVDRHFRAGLDNFYAAGEVCGSHGVRRPGGCALNAGQAGSLWAALSIAAGGEEDIPAMTAEVEEQMDETLARSAALARGGVLDAGRWVERIRRRMDESCSFVRSGPAVEAALRDALADLGEFEEKVLVRDAAELKTTWLARDLLITQAAVLTAAHDYIKRGGGSRGSALVTDPGGIIPLPGLDEYAMKPSDRSMDGRVQQLRYEKGEFTASWRDVRPLPDADTWFETVWADYQRGGAFR